MFGFKQKKEVVTPDITDTLSPMDVLKTKCRVSTIGQSEYLIANDLDTLSADECVLLYKSWGDEFKKTDLFKQLIGEDLLYLSHDTSVTQEQFTRLNINQLQILCQWAPLAPRRSEYTNSLATSGLFMSYEHDTHGNCKDIALSIMNAENKCLLKLETKQTDTRISQHKSDTRIMHFVPGPWLSTLASDLSRIPEFRKDVEVGNDLIKSQAQRDMIRDAMQIN